VPNDDTVGKGGWGGENVSKSDGAILECSLREIKKLIRAKCTRLNLDEAKTTATEFRTLSVYLQRSNGRILINRDIQCREEPNNYVIENDI